MKKYFKNFYKYRFLFTEIVRKNIKLQYRNSVLGMFWTFLQPLLTMIVLAFIFGNIFGRDESKVLNYPVYLLCGRLLYEFYSQATKRAMRSIRNSASVIKKVYVPKYIYPMANVASNFITFLISLLVLAVVMAYYMIFTDTAMRLTPYILLSFVPILILFVLCVGVGMILCTMEVFFKDVEYMYEVFCMLLFYATPIFYNVETLHITVCAHGEPALFDSLDVQGLRAFRQGDESESYNLLRRLQHCDAAHRRAGVLQEAG